MARVDIDPPATVLFACDMNTVRSPMAAGLMRHFFGHRSSVMSAGVKQGEEVNGFAIASMAELGIDISSHQPQTLEDINNNGFDLVISLTPKAHHTILEHAFNEPVEAEYWPTLDPTLVLANANGNRDQAMDAFREVRDGLWIAIKQRFGEPSAPVV